MDRQLHPLGLASKLVDRTRNSKNIVGQKDLLAVMIQKQNQRPTDSACSPEPEGTDRDNRV